MTANSALLPRGRPTGAVVLMDVERNLTPGDVARMALGGKVAVAQPIIQKIKHSHRLAARLIAQGLDLTEVSAQTGYTPQRLSDLSVKDPAFMNLVAAYADQMAEIDLTAGQRLQAKLIDIAETAADEISARLDDPKAVAAMSMDELRRTSEFGLDRTILPNRVAAPIINVPAQITFKIGTRDIRTHQIESREPESRELIDITPNQKGDNDEQSNALAHGSSSASHLDRDEDSIDSRPSQLAKSDSN